MKTDISALKTDMVTVKGTMVTKDYLDIKMANLRGDLILIDRKEDEKLDAAIETLAHKKFFAPHEKKRLLGMGPFPKKHST